MKFGKKYSNITVFMAMFQGVIIGVAAIAVIGFILAGAEGKRAIDKIEEEIPASGPESTNTETSPAEKVELLNLFARQHGVFTTPASAATFIAADPSLATAAIIQSDGQYFVWSAVGLTEEEIMNSEQADTYKKAFSVNTSACEIIGTEKFREVLQAKKIEEIKISENEKNDDKMNEFNRHLSTITAFTEDLKVVRLHLLSQYSYSKDCVKISF